MRLALSVISKSVFLCISLSLLTSCFGLHAQSHPIKPDELHLDTTQATTVTKFQTDTWPSDNWWTTFNDPQLDDLVQQAIANQPNLKIAAARVRLAEQLANYANGANFPSLNAFGNVTRERFTANGFVIPPFAGTIRNIGNLGINFNYDFDFWGKNKNAFAAALSKTQATQADEANARLILAASVANYYFALQSYYAQAATTSAIVEQNNILLRLTKQRAQDGIDSMLMVNQAEATAANAQIRLLQLHQKITLTQHQIAALMGLSPEDDLVEIKPLANFKQIPPLPSDIPSNLLARRPDITASIWRVKAAASQVKVAKAQFLPDVNLVSAVAFETIGLQTFFNARSIDAAVGPVFTLPIFQGGQLRANLGAKYAQYDIAVEKYNQTLITALQQVADQITIYQDTVLQQRAQDATLHATRANYELADDRFRSGVTNRLDLANNTVTWLTQRNIQTQLQAQRLQATLGLIKALGGGYLETNHHAS